MGLVREPLDVDFVVEPRMLTAAESAAISKYIREYKAKRMHKAGDKKKPIRQKKKVLA